MTKAKPKRQHQKVGRPSVVTDEALLKLEYAFKLGCTKTEACSHAEISQSTFYLFLDRDKEFSDKITRWMEEPFFIARKSVVEGMAGDPDLALKYLERKKKDEFSTKQEHDVKETLTVNINDKDSGTL